MDVMPEEKNNDGAEMDGAELEKSEERAEGGEAVSETDADDVPLDEAVQYEENQSLASEPAAEPKTDEQLEIEQPEDVKNEPAPPIFAHEENIETSVESVIEAVLFTNDEPLTDSRIAAIVEIESAKQVRDAIESLNAKYRANNSAFRVEKIAGGYQMLTLSVYKPWLEKLIRVRTDSKLSQAALETLAIISYKQPIIRADVEAIRGVAAGEVIRSLMFKGLVKIAGRAEIVGRPMLYGTTKKFLEVFGLASLKDLPKIEELKKPQQ
jgi:segregation and condensation protein B